MLLRVLVLVGLWWGGSWWRPPCPHPLTPHHHLHLHPRPFSVSGYVLVGVEVGGCTVVLVFGDPEDVVLVLVCRQYTCSTNP